MQRHKSSSEKSWPNKKDDISTKKIDVIQRKEREGRKEKERKEQQLSLKKFIGPEKTERKTAAAARSICYWHVRAKSQGCTLRLKLEKLF